MMSVTTLRSAVSLSFRPVAAVLAALSMRRERHRLAELDQHLLRDIGVTRAEVEAELARPFWDAPRHWQRR